MQGAGTAASLEEKQPRPAVVGITGQATLVCFSENKEEREIHISTGEKEGAGKNAPHGRDTPS